jgi:hypothetical protein
MVKPIDQAIQTYQNFKTANPKVALGVEILFAISTILGLGVFAGVTALGATSLVGTYALHGLPSLEFLNHFWNGTPHLMTVAATVGFLITLGTMLIGTYIYLQSRKKEKEETAKTDNEIVMNEEIVEEPSHITKIELQTIKDLNSLLNTNTIDLETNDVWDVEGVGLNNEIMAKDPKMIQSMRADNILFIYKAKANYASLQAGQTVVTYYDSEMQKLNTKPLEEVQKNLPDNPPFNLITCFQDYKALAKSENDVLSMKIEVENTEGSVQGETSSQTTKLIIEIKGRENDEIVLRKYTVEEIIARNITNDDRLKEKMKKENIFFIFEAEGVPNIVSVFYYDEKENKVVRKPWHVNEIREGQHLSHFKKNYKIITDLDELKKDPSKG